MAGRLSVCLIARDEATNLPRCLASLPPADEIVVVVDDRTRDDTAEVARRHGARVIVRRYEGDVASKRFAVAEGRGDWILLIDPDEELSPELAAEIGAVLAADAPACSAYEVNRITWHLGRWIRHGAFFPDWVLRLFRRDAVRFEGVDPHGRFLAAGRVRRLEGLLRHYSYRDLADQLARVQAWSDAAARAKHARGERATLEKRLLRPPARFLRDYLWKRGFLDGTPGFFIAAISAFHVFVKYAKLWELERRDDRPE
jgi:glycosyltransferase involved in cell wall biosynthesis